MYMSNSNHNQPPRNVIVFGESGVGKSSVVNMIAGRHVAKISSDAKGCTFESTPYEVNISGSRFRLFDTAGLNEATTVKPREAVVKLYKLVQSLEAGICLLMYVMRGPRIKDFTVKNYNLFREVICDNRVPTVLVVTGLELEDSMEGWWDDNAKEFDRHGMMFDGQACITATMGKERKGVWMFQDEYQDSQQRLRRLLLNNSLRIPWKMEKQWIVTVVKKVWNSFAKLFNWPLVPYDTTLYEALMRVGHFTAEEALELANGLVDGFTTKAEGEDRTESKT